MFSITYFQSTIQKKCIYNKIHQQLLKILNMQTILSEIPSELKQLAKLVVRGFYDIEYSLIIDMLVRYHCMREIDLCDILKFDKKFLRGKLATLKADKFVVMKLKIETREDGKAVKMNCWFINYRIFVNIVKYKLDNMRKKIETEERDARRQQPQQRQVRGVWETVH